MLMVYTFQIGHVCGTIDISPSNNIRDLQYNLAFVRLEPDANLNPDPPQERAIAGWRDPLELKSSPELRTVGSYTGRKYHKIAIVGEWFCHSITAKAILWRTEMLSSGGSRSGSPIFVGEGDKDFVIAFQNGESAKDSREKFGFVLPEDIRQSEIV